MLYNSFAAVLLSLIGVTTLPYFWSPSAVSHGLLLGGRYAPEDKGRKVKVEAARSPIVANSRLER